MSGIYPALKFDNAWAKHFQRVGGAPLPVWFHTMPGSHGDSDHADNAAYLHEKYDAKIALHAFEAPLVERGDKSCTRQPKPDKVNVIFRLMLSLMPLIAKGNAFQTFTPDFTIDEGFDLSEYGFNAKILYLPGHSKGSIGLLTTGSAPSTLPAVTGQALFCGDLLPNFLGRPGCLFIDNLTDFRASIEKLRGLEVKGVYPGHGKPFPLEQFLRQNR